jgi:hypothetical protein
VGSKWPRIDPTSKYQHLVYRRSTRSCGVSPKCPLMARFRCFHPLPPFCAYPIDMLIVSGKYLQINGLQNYQNKFRCFWVKFLYYRQHQVHRGRAQKVPSRADCSANSS